MLTQAHDLPSRLEMWPTFWRESYEERVAIMRFDAEMDEATAKVAAEKATRKQCFLAWCFAQTKKGTKTCDK